ncbi:MAG TPA: hypothetical protein VMZ71_14670 [Gemmataceae bacterium]|nr:hypothetical protein [Gemmataceae bacterium]
MWLFCGLLAGCGSPSPAAPQPPHPAPPASTAFDAARCGRIAGRVTWHGSVPDAPPFKYSVGKADGNFESNDFGNPNRLQVDPATKGVAGAVVFLTGVDPSRAKPWDLPSVRVELLELQIVVKQGNDAPKRAGFVRRGDAVPMASSESNFHVLRGRGAAYFSLAFPAADKALTRTFDKVGRVELSSGAGYYWAHANLFVCDHPYFALTDTEGRFEFEQVPADEANVVAWHPSWNAARLERDPETGLVSRLTYAAPLEVVAPTTIEMGRTASAELRLR